MKKSDGVVAVGGEDSWGELRSFFGVEVVEGVELKMELER